MLINRFANHSESILLK